MIDPRLRVLDRMGLLVLCNRSLHYCFLVVAPVILKQQARIERLKIELRTEKAKLEVMQNEVADLEGNRVKPIEYKIDAEVEKQLRREIKHLQYQCEQLALEADKSKIIGFGEIGRCRWDERWQT